VAIARLQSIVDRGPEERTGFRPVGRGVSPDEDPANATLVLNEALRGRAPLMLFVLGPGAGAVGPRTTLTARSLNTEGSRGRAGAPRLLAEIAGCTRSAAASTGDRSI